MGIPVLTSGSGTSTDINALPFAAYQCVYNEYYRDQNLIPSVTYKLENGDNNSNVSELLQLRKRAWEHDYFTASLPFAQKGNAVDIPIGAIEGDARVLVNGNTVNNQYNQLYLYNTGGISTSETMTFGVPTPGSVGGPLLS